LILACPIIPLPLLPFLGHLAMRLIFPEAFPKPMAGHQVFIELHTQACSLVRGHEFRKRVPAVAQP
jgi:hypothetical protein